MPQSAFLTTDSIIKTSKPTDMSAMIEQDSIMIPSIYLKKAESI